MDPYQKEIMNALRDGKPRNFQQILEEIGFSHNTLRLHLNSMVDEGLVAREKMPSKGRGRPVYLYSVSIEVSGEVVALRFGDLKRLYRFKRGGKCRETKARCDPEYCPQIGKKD